MQASANSNKMLSIFQFIPGNETKAESKSREPETEPKAESKCREPKTDPKAESKSGEPENELKSESKSQEPGVDSFQLKQELVDFLSSNAFSFVNLDLVSDGAR
jgi:hypothetical protein